MKKILLTDVGLLILILGLFFSVKAPTPVQGLAVDNTTYNSVELSWKKADNATGYHIYRTSNGDDYEYVNSTNDTSYKDSKLETGKTYSYIVKPHNGLRKAKSSKEVKATPNLDTPKITSDTSSGHIELHIDAVKGAQKYKVLRNEKELKVIEGKTFIDDTAESDTEYSYEVKACRNNAESKASNKVEAELISPGKIEANIRGEDVILTWGNEEYSSYKVFNGDELLTETTDTRYSMPAELETYNIKVVGYAEDIQSPSEEKNFKIEEAEMDNKAAIQGAIDWAVDIAADDSFTYGKKPETSKVGCYFCGTNQKRKPKGYEKTYVCMTFVTAAYAHGAHDPEVYDVCSSGRACLSCTDSNFSNFSCWKKVGLCRNLSVSDLQPGDVIVWYDPKNSNDGHMSMYIGDGNICDASGGGWSAKSIAVRNGKARNYLNYRGNKNASRNYVMRYTGKGSGKMKVIKDV